MMTDTPYKPIDALRAELARVTAERDALQDRIIDITAALKIAERQQDEREWTRREYHQHVADLCNALSNPHNVLTDDARVALALLRQDMRIIEQETTDS